MSEEFKAIVRIAGVDLDGEKSIAYAIKGIKCVGIATAFALCRKLNIDPYRKLGSLSDSEIKKLDDAIRNISKLGFPYWFLNRPKDPETGEHLHLIGSDLVFRVKMDIELMKKIRSWKGIRHMYGLKVRGQRTRTTGRTGMTVGVTRRKR